jgi:hypothetical protein
MPSDVRVWVRRAHQEIHLGLWAVLIAALVFASLFALPQLRARQNAQEIVRSHEIEAEDRAYCTKWKFAPGSAEFRSCMSDLVDFRASIEKRAAADNEF